jgi:molybdopterin converting factor small subunit
MIVELTGVARLRAGRAHVDLEASNLAEALARLIERCPGVVPDVVSCDGELGRHFIVSLNGGPFSRDRALALADGDRLLIVGAQSGG